MTPTQKNIFAIVVAVIILGGTVLLVRGNTAQKLATPANNVAVVDGVQVITINAKGGYQPRTSVATAGIPTVIRFSTKGTFDCSASVRIPSMNISTILPQSGASDIPLGTPAAGTLVGSCGMGMYPFSVEFQAAAPEAVEQ